MAFGEVDGAPVEPFLMGIATLGLLTAAAEERLVVCLVDDAHWLDDASADALLFCTRRIAADRVAMVFSVRDGVPSRMERQRLTELSVTGLAADEARELLDLALAGVTADDVVERLLAEAHGNPLALLELPRALSPEELDGAVALPPQLRLTDRVEGLFLDRVRRLPDAVQAVLLLAAADDTGELAVLRTAASRLGLPSDAIASATSSGLVTADGDAMTLRHPLVRSAVYQAAADDERRRAHAALAAALDTFGRQDRVAWHRAAATVEPDAEVVAALERVGQRAQRGGAHTAARAAFARAAELAAEPQQRAGLTFAAARSAWAAGEAARARDLITEATRIGGEPSLLADLARLRGHIEVNLGSPDLAHRIFVEAAAEVLPTDGQRALELATLAAIMRAHGADSGTRLPEAEVLTHPVRDEPARTACLRQLLLSMTHAADGDLRGASQALTSAAAIGTDVDDREVLWNVGNCALHLGNDDVQLQYYSLALSRARDAGAVTAVVYALQRLCFSHFVAGDMLAVRTNAEEALALGETLHQSAMTTPPRAWLTLLAALQGADDYDDLLRAVDDGVAQAPLGILADPVHDLGRWAKGTRAAAVGDLSGAAHHLGRFRMSGLARMATVQHIDAAVRAGEPETAVQLVDELADFAEATGHPWALAALSYGRAVTTASASDAEGLFEAALTHQRAARRPLDEARIQLAYGEWLRRAGRRVDARVHLRRALESFRDARAEPLVQRTTQELRASGETARKRDPSTLVKLTPMELKIAQLVATGMSNKDVAATSGCRPGPSPSTCATSSPRRGLPRVASSPGSTWAEASRRRARPWRRRTWSSDRGDGTRPTPRSRAGHHRLPSEAAMTDKTATHIVAGSLAAGAAIALVLSIVVFPGATESVIAGSVLLGSGWGWAMLAVLSARRTSQPQRWAAVPAAAMAAAGLALVAFAPGDALMGQLNWVWPPLMIGLAGWAFVQVRRSLTGRGRWLLYPALAVLAAASVGATFANLSEAQVRRDFAPPGAMYDVDGHQMHLWCQGQGTPTVVLFSGLGEISTSWAHITQRVQSTTRVCAYDRVGQAWSEDVATPETGIQAADDLHALLAAAGEQGPFVLAGHSIGGPYAMVFTARYPAQVAGLVLLDSSSPEQMTAIPAYPGQYAVMRRGLAVLPILARIGLGRAFSTGSGLPGDAAAETVAMTGTARALRNGRDEISMVPTLFEQSQALTSLDGRPLFVLTASESLDIEGWQAAQGELVQLSADHVANTVQSSHEGMVADDRVAAESSDAITAVVSSVRTGRPLR